MENKVSETNKNKDLIIGVMACIIVVLIAALVYFAFIKKADKPIDNKGGNNPPEINNPNNDDHQNGTKEELYNEKLSHNIKLISAYEAENENKTITIYLYDDGTYYYNESTEISNGSFGTYTTDNNTLVLNKVLEHGNGSGYTFDKEIESSKYTIKSDGLYDINSGNLKFKKTNNKNIHQYKLFEELFNYLKYGDNICLSKADEGIYIDAFCK